MPAVIGTGVRGRVAAAVAGLAAFVGVAAPAAAFDPALEVQNFAKTAERMQYVTLTPEFQTRLIEANTQNLADMATITAGDPERVFITNVCAQKGNECAGDVRFYDWAAAGFGMVEPVLFTARNGSTISGRVWAAATGPAKRPAGGHHDGLGPGPRAALLGPGGDARQARLRGAHLRRPGPGPLRHVRRRGRPARRRAVAAGPAVLRRHRGRARLRCSRRPTTRTTRARAALRAPTTRRSRTGA